MTFLDAAEKLHGYFTRYADQAGLLTTPHQRRPFKQIEAEIQAILALEAEAPARARAWEQACQRGVFSAEKEAIPDYLGESWAEGFNHLVAQADSTQLKQSEIVNFYQAAAFHRFSILRDILPEHGLMVG